VPAEQLASEQAISNQHVTTNCLDPSAAASPWRGCVLLLPQRMPNGFLLGEWCAARRSEYAHGELETDVADALSNGVPGWCWNLGDTAFEHNLEVLQQVGGRREAAV
jgi:hypothetical protein